MINIDDRPGVPVALAAGSLMVWVLLLAAAPVLPAVPAALLYLVGAGVCHQLPDRSLHLGSTQLPVCARCCGIYAGAAMGMLAFWLSRHTVRATRHVGAWRVLAMAAVPTIITVTAEWAGWWQTSNLARLMAGVPLGVGGGLVVGGALATLHYGRCPPRPPAAVPRLP